MPPVSCDQNSNSSISNILHSVLNEHSINQRSTRANSVHSSETVTPSQSSSNDDGLAATEIDSHVGLMMSENSVGFARATNFYDILENDIPS